MKNLKLFDNHSKYDAYSNSVDYVLPNVSYCVEDKCLHYKKFVKNNYLKLKYNVTSTSEATQLIAESRLTDLEEIIIDGNSISPEKEYTFATAGEHDVWFKFTDEAINYNGSGSAYVSGFDSNQNIIEIIEIPTDLLQLTNGAFGGCGIIKANLYTPNGKLQNISNGAFSNSISLKQIIFPNTVLNIAGSAFYGCNALTELNLPNSLKTIGLDAFCNCTVLNELIIPNSVEIIDASAFNGCAGIERLVLSSSMKVIYTGNWVGNTNLKEVIIPEGIEIINSGAFAGCTGLTEITLPSTIIEVQMGAFNGCSKILEITSLAATPTISHGACSGVASNGTLYVPYGCTEAYSAWMEDDYLGRNGWTIQELPQE